MIVIKQTKINECININGRPILEVRKRVIVAINKKIH